MLTGHDSRAEHEVPRDGETPRAPAEPQDAQMEFPTLEEPTWFEEDPDEDLEEPRDSAFRGIWIGAATAAVMFVLVFAIPHWLGWYDVGTPERARREATPDSVIATVTARPSSGAPADEPTAAAPASTPPAKPIAATAAAPTPAPAPPVALPKAPPRPAPSASSAVATKSTKADRPASPAAAKRTFSVQIAAFKDAKQAGRLAERVKRDGYPVDVRRVESQAAPWAVRVGSYASREQAESAREALARKGFRGFVL